MANKKIQQLTTGTELKKTDLLIKGNDISDIEFPLQKITGEMVRDFVTDFETGVDAITNSDMNESISYPSVAQGLVIGGFDEDESRVNFQQFSTDTTHPTRKFTQANTFVSYNGERELSVKLKDAPTEGTINFTLSDSVSSTVNTMTITPGFAGLGIEDPVNGLTHLMQLDPNETTIGSIFGKISDTGDAFVNIVGFDNVQMLARVGADESFVNVFEGQINIEATEYNSNADTYNIRNKAGAIISTFATTGVEIDVAESSDTFKLVNLPTYTDNASAVSGGLTTDCVYKTAGGELRIVV